VIVVGAGAVGLSAAYLLNQRGIQVQILEALSVFGGRMKRVTDFADFPIPTGAEWLHAFLKRAKMPDR
jgi:monoamine oxidase